MRIDLRKGITKNIEYEATKFPGGEINVKLTSNSMDMMRIQRPLEMQLITNFRSSDDLMLCCIMCDLLRKINRNIHVNLDIPYMAYAQADRDFGQNENFSLVTIVKMLSRYGINSVTLFDPHSDVVAGMFSVLDIGVKVNTNIVLVNSAITEMALQNAGKQTREEYIKNNLVVLSPDAGAYKKIGKLAAQLKLDCDIETAVKIRDHEHDTLVTHVYREDFMEKDVLIIDDICVGGRTFIDLAERLQNKNIGNLYLAVSHGIFSNNFGELYQFFDGIFTTNSYQTSKEITDKVGWSVPKGTPDDINPSFFVKIVTIV